MTEQEFIQETLHSLYVSKNHFKNLLLSDCPADYNLTLAEDWMNRQRELKERYLELCKSIANLELLVTN